MFRLVYVSTCVPSLAMQDVAEIMQVAHPRNVERGISGMLCWSGEFFLQCLEGERSAVSAVFAKICRDPRHHSVEILIAAPTAVRWFGEWGMGFSRLMASNLQDLSSAQAKSFNPYLLEATQLESTFERLSMFAQRLAIE